VNVYVYVIVNDTSRQHNRSRGLDMQRGRPVDRPPLLSTPLPRSLGIDTHHGFDETDAMRTGQSLSLPGMLCAVLLAGCSRAPEPPPVPPEPTERARLIRQADQGVVAVVLAPHPLSADAPPDGVHRALVTAAQSAPCAAAAFLYTERVQAERWILSECARRRQAGIAPRVVLAGHSLGATEAGELAKRLLAATPDIVVEMLVTVDAVKTGTIGATTGMSATVLTLANPIPGKDVYFLAYSGTPRADGTRVRSHVNYYQLETKLYHGAPIGGASENHRIQADPARSLSHATVDDHAFPMVLSDLRHALRQGGAP